MSGVTLSMLYRKINNWYRRITYTEMVLRDLEILSRSSGWVGPITGRKEYCAIITNSRCVYNNEENVSTYLKNRRSRHEI